MLITLQYLWKHLKYDMWTWGYFLFPWSMTSYVRSWRCFLYSWSMRYVTFEAFFSPQSMACELGVLLVWLKYDLCVLVCISCLLEFSWSMTSLTWEIRDLPKSFFNDGANLRNAKSLFYTYEGWKQGWLIDPCEVSS